MSNHSLIHNDVITSVTQELENLRNSNHYYSTNAFNFEKEYNDLKERSKKQ